MVHREKETQRTPEERLARFKFKISAIPQDWLKMPVGILDKEGRLFTKARVRPMTGKDRKECAHGKAQRSQAHMTTALLSQCLLLLADEEEQVQAEPDLRLIRKMTEADRSYLALEIRRRTYPGQKMNMISECENPRCKQRIDWGIDLEDIQIHLVKPEWRDGYPCFKVEDEDLGVIGWMRYFNGEDSERLSQRFGNQPEAKINPVEMLQAMVAFTVIELNGQSVMEEDLEVFPQEINAVLEEAINDHQAGPDLRPWLTCPECFHEMLVNVSVVDFLLRGRRRKGFQS